MTDSKDPVMEVNVTQGFYSNGEVTSIHEVYYHGPSERVPSWHTGNGELLSTGWYYWDETWGSCYGPFEDEEECRKSLGLYTESL